MSLSRSVYYYKSVKDDSEVIRKLEELSSKHARWGCDKFYDIIRNEGLAWNYKRIRRVYCLMKLNLKRKAKRRLPARVKQPLMQPPIMNKSWSMDFMSDALLTGRKIRILNIIDDYNREALSIEVDTSMTSEKVIRTLVDLIDWRGKPISIRVDNGPEFTSFAFIDWCTSQGITVQYTQPGKPMQNGYIERFNRSYREDILDAYLFNDLSQVRILSEEWMEEYNNLRPHESLNGLPPIKYLKLKTCT
jgi:putative transposase